MGRTPASYIPGMQSWIAEARGSRGGIICRVKGMKQGREEGSFARPCDSLHTQVHRNNSRFLWITAGIVWHWGRNQRGKGKTSSFANIRVTVCSGCRASSSSGHSELEDNSRTFIKKMSFPSTLPHRWAMWVPISFLWSHMGFPPALHLILYGFSKSISSLKLFCLQKACLLPSFVLAPFFACSFQEGIQCCSVKVTSQERQMSWPRSTCPSNACLRPLKCPVGFSGGQCS